MKTLRVVKLDELAILPQYAHPGDSGLDLFSIEEQELLAGESKKIRCGIAIELPEGTEAQIRPRSGLALKYKITVLNSPGTIDAGYRGEIAVLLINHGQETFRVTRGMKIGQLVVTPVIQVNIELQSSLTETLRGENGFGSTGI